MTSASSSRYASWTTTTSHDLVAQGQRPEFEHMSKKNIEVAVEPVHVYQCRLWQSAVRTMKLRVLGLSIWVECGASNWEEGCWTLCYIYVEWL
jgi:hypothetical protein